jgi:deoxyhypusine synthase
MARESSRRGESLPRHPGSCRPFAEIRYSWDGTNCAEALNTEVLQKQDEIVSTPSSDLNCLALLKHYQSLMPMAQESHKPIFHFKPADGAIGAHIYTVTDVYKDSKDLSEKIAS